MRTFLLTGFVLLTGFALASATSAGVSMHPVWIGSGAGSFSTDNTFAEDFRCDGDTVVVAVRWPAAVSPLDYEIAFTDGPPNAGPNLGCNFPTWDAWTAVEGSPEAGFFGRIVSSNGCSVWEMRLGAIGQATPFSWTNWAFCAEDPSVTRVEASVDF